MSEWQRVEGVDYMRERGDALVLVAGIQGNGVTYELHPLSRQRLWEAHPGVKFIPSLMIGWETPGEVVELQGGQWGTVAAVLTGQTNGEWAGHLAVYFPQDRVEYRRAEEVTDVVASP